MPSMLHQSARQLKYAKAINLLRSAGVSHHVSLPQIVACGDQSSGKSSVMEAITSGIPFPTSDGLCTRYPTEIICRNWTKPGVKITASIIPEPSRSATKQAALRQFHVEREDYHDIDDIIAKANEAIKLSEEHRNFSADILRIELYSTEVSNLTIIDLPGLFHSGVATQTSDDCAFVRDLVEKYMQQPRTLILAVLHTKVDPTSQVVLELAQKADPEGKRTLGIITKPDILSMESEPTVMDNFIALARNTNRPLDLGYHVLKNRAHKERDCSNEERDQLERDFFSTAKQWKDLPKDITGIEALDKKLTQLSCRTLEEDAAQIIPEVVKIAQQLREQENNLARSSYTTRNALTALYAASNNFNLVINRISQGYLPQTDDEALPLMKKIDNDVTAFGQCLKDDNHAWARVSSVSSQDIERPLSTILSENELITHVEQKILRQICKMPGLLDMEIVSELFHDRAKPWFSLIEMMVSSVVMNVEQCLRSTLKQVLMNDLQILEGVYRQLLEPVLKQLQTQLLSHGGETLQGLVNRKQVSPNPQCYSKVKEARAMFMKALAESKFSQFGENVAFNSGSHGGAQEALHREQLVDGFFQDGEKTESFAAREIIAYAREHYQIESRKLINRLDFSEVWPIIKQSFSSILSHDVIGNLSDDQLQQMIDQEVEDSEERTLVRTRAEEIETAVQLLSEIKAQPGDAKRASSDNSTAPPAKRVKGNY